MAPTEHLAWLEDNVQWFSVLNVQDLARDVPACHGWNVEYVVNHLTFGLAVAYPVAMAASPTTPAELVFVGVQRPTSYPGGQQALDLFASKMSECLERFRGTDPSAPCWTYAGAGTAAFWFRRAAIETTLHRMDVAEALNSETDITDDRVADAILEALTFALPLAGTITSPPVGQLVVETSCLDHPVSVGSGNPIATLKGEPHHVLNALWGRHREHVDVTGDQDIADTWLSLVETAFAGR